MPRKVVPVSVFVDGTPRSRAREAISTARFENGATAVVALYASRDDARVIGDTIDGVSVYGWKLAPNTFEVAIEVA